MKTCHSLKRHSLVGSADGVMHSMHQVLTKHVVGLHLVMACNILQANGTKMNPRAVSAPVPPICRLMP